MFILLNYLAHFGRRKKKIKIIFLLNIIDGCFPHYLVQTCIRFRITSHQIAKQIYSIMISQQLVAILYLPLLLYYYHVLYYLSLLTLQEPFTAPPPLCISSLFYFLPLICIPPPTPYPNPNAPSLMYIRPFNVTNRFKLWH